MAGRPTTLTPEIRDKILHALSKGNYRTVAAQYAGVSYKTLKSWLTRGKKEPDTIYGEFLASVLETETKAEIDAVGKLIEEPKDPRFIIEWLSRKFPERWAKETYRFKKLEQDFREIQAVIREMTGLEQQRESLRREREELDRREQELRRREQEGKGE